MFMLEAIGDLPVRNFRDGLFPEVSKIHGGVIKDTVRIGMGGCYACPIRCKKIVQFDEPYHVDPVYGGPEYETLAALGSDCGISDLKAIIKANERCNAYSIDTISAGSTIAFAMECFEKGLLTTKDTDGIELRFGNHEAMLEVIELIARRQGFGNLLAEGTARMAEKIGKESEAFAMHVKGLEPGMHEPRADKALGLAFMISPTGADHCNNEIPMLNTPMNIGMMEPLGILEMVPPDDFGPRRVALYRFGGFGMVLFDCLVVCMSPPFTYQMLAELLAAVTGWDANGVPLPEKVEELYIE
jgi:aldehyde:ferredoxin oxidoreductase